MDLLNIAQFVAIVKKYEDMLNEEENFDYHKFDELFENFINNCERLSQTIVRNVDLSLIFNKIINLWCI